MNSSALLHMELPTLNPTIVSGSPSNDQKTLGLDAFNGARIQEKLQTEFLKRSKHLLYYTTYGQISVSFYGRHFKMLAGLGSREGFNHLKIQPIFNKDPTGKTLRQTLASYCECMKTIECMIEPRVDKSSSRASHKKFIYDQCYTLLTYSKADQMRGWLPRAKQYQQAFVHVNSVYDKYGAVFKSSRRNPLVSIQKLFYCCVYGVLNEYVGRGRRKDL